MSLSHLCVFLSTDNHLLPTEIRKQALGLQKLLEFDDEGGDGKSLSLLRSFTAFLLDLNTGDCASSQHVKERDI